MGLEAATYISELDANNPLAGDKKQQGDDHLRLLKEVLQDTFPNADRAVRFEDIVTKSANYAILLTDNREVILCDTSAGAFTLTLPAPAFTTAETFIVTVVKKTADVNPVFVAGTIDLAFSKVRINVPFKEHRFVWNGSSWFRSPFGDVPGGITIFSGTVAPTGYGSATGQSLLRADYPELFAAWSTTFGAADGTHFNAPDLRDRFPTFSGGSYAVAATGGEASHVLIAAELPTGIGGLGLSLTDSRAWRTDRNVVANDGGTQNPTGLGGPGWTSTNKVNMEVVSGALSGSITGNLGSNSSHENRPPYFAFMPIFRLC